MHAKQITLRNPSPELSKRLRTISMQTGESMNSLILRLLKQAVGLDERRERLMRYATASSEDLNDMLKATQLQREIDSNAWK